MPVEIKVPYLGHNIEDATLNHWLKAEGQEVKENEILLELEAEKAVLEIESPKNGTLASIIISEGSIVKTDDVLGYIAEPGEDFEPLQIVAKPDLKPAEESPETPLVEAKNAPKQILVIGGGPGGYTAAIKASQRGSKVILVEKAKLGGTCLHTGCMPTKAYLAKARVIEQLADAADIFTGSKGVKVNLKQLMAFKDKAVGKLTNGIKSLMKSNNIEVITGKAEFVSQTSLSIKP